MFCIILKYSSFQRWRHTNNFCLSCVCFIIYVFFQLYQKCSTLYFVVQNTEEKKKTFEKLPLCLLWSKATNIMTKNPIYLKHWLKLLLLLFEIPWTHTHIHTCICLHVLTCEKAQLLNLKRLMQGWHHIRTVVTIGVKDHWISDTLAFTTIRLPNSRTDLFISVNSS